MFRHHDAPPPGTVYQMRQQIFAIGDDFWVQDQAGRRVFRIDGKALRVRKTLLLEDHTGERYKIQEKLVHIRDTMEIEDPTGHTVATVKKHLVTPLKERYDIHFTSGDEWKAVGNIVDHEYEIENPRGKVAEVSKKWFRVADSYAIAVVPEHDDALIIAIAVVIDTMSHPAR